jgi:hypothetical protein
MGEEERRFTTEQEERIFLLAKWIFFFLCDIYLSMHQTIAPEWAFLQIMPHGVAAEAAVQETQAERRRGERSGERRRSSSSSSSSSSSETETTAQASASADSPAPAAPSASVSISANVSAEQAGTAPAETPAAPAEPASSSAQSGNNIPAGTTRIEDSAYANKGLTGHLAIPAGVTNMGSGAFRNNQLTSVTIPDSISYISYYTFENNRLTGHLTIPASVMTIEEGAFTNNQLTSVTITAYIATGLIIREIRNNAFTNNPALTSVTIEGSNFHLWENAFDGNLGTVFSETGAKAGVYVKEGNNWRWAGEASPSQGNRPAPAVAPAPAAPAQPGRSGRQ